MTKNKPLAVEIIDITKTFLNGKVVANDKVNLKVEQNDIHAIIGENGAGKSTLMSMLFGVYEPDSGTIKINGKEVNFESAKSASDAGLGMVHQHFKLVDEFTVWENVILGVEGVGRLQIIKQKEIKDKLQALIDQYDFKINVNKKIIIATGNGSFSPRKLEINNKEIDSDFIHYSLSINHEIYSNKKIVVLGGGDSAVEWANFFIEENITKDVTIVHRRNEYRSSSIMIENLSKNNVMQKLNYEIINFNEFKKQITIKHKN